MVEGFLKDLIKEGDKVVVGVSGGADSVCLLLNLCELSEKKDVRILAVYIEHGIRGESSLSDGRFVENLCDRLGVEFIEKSVDAPGEAKRLRISEEEAARNLRYEMLLSIAQNKGFKKLAVAHNANDNAETILFQLVRGTGVAGLLGMDEKSKRDGITIIRPLLTVKREAIEQYLRDAGQDFVTDETNLNDEYSRNRIRHKVLPELLAINNKAIEHINASAADLKKQLVSEESVRRLYEEACGGRELSVDVLSDHSPSLRQSVIRLWIRDIGISRDVGRAHYEAIDRLITSGTGKSVDLPGNQQVERVYNRLRLKKKVAKYGGRTTADDSDEDVTHIPRLRGGEKTELAMDGWYVRLTLYTGEDVERIRKNKSFQKNYAKFYDYGKIDGNMVLRHRREKDLLVISTDGRTKTLSRYFVDEKVPRDERDEAWLLCTGSKVIYAFGYRGSEDARVDEGTKEILEVEFWRT